jgi:hypothetical protein
MQIVFDFAPRQKVMLIDIQQYLEKHKVLGASAPCRETIIGWIEEGTLDGFLSPLGWMVFADSFESFVKRLDRGDTTVFRRLAAKKLDQCAVAA